MKPPILHVKKGVEIYDDVRQEELRARLKAAAEEAEARPRRRGVRRGLTFLPLAVIGLALAAALQLAWPRDTARFSGWDARLRAVPYGGVVLFSVTFTPRLPGAQQGAGTLTAVVTVPVPDTKSAVNLTGELGSEEVTLRGQFPLPEKSRRVRADIVVGGERRSVSVTLPAER
jgi:hypothetical protein